VDGAVPLRVCAIGVGDRRHSLESCRAAALVQALPEVRPAVMAQGF